MQVKSILRMERPAVTEDALLRILHMPADTDPEDIGTIRDMLAQASALAVPKAVYDVAPISEKGDGYVTVGDVTIRSPLVRENLDGAGRIVPFVATCGAELEEWSRAYDGDPLKQYWADGIKLLYLSVIRAEMTQTVRRSYFPSGDMSAMSPGSLAAWPLTEQAKVFRLLGGVTEDIGVKLTDSFLMLPSKSSSGFFFSARTHYENCRLCPMANCPNRRAEYDPAAGSHTIA